MLSIISQKIRQIYNKENRNSLNLQFLKNCRYDYTLLDSLHFLPQTDKTMRCSMNIYIHGPKVGTAQCLLFQKFPTFQMGNSSNV